MLREFADGWIRCFYGAPGTSWARGALGVSVLSTSVTKQTGDMVYFEELGVELITPGLFRDMEIGELNSEELRFRAARRVV
jgi:hypothetical protein